MIARFIADSLVTSRKIVMPEQINTNGTLFGGVLMSWIDKVALMTAQKHCGTRMVVTASVESIEFIRSASLGDHLILTSTLGGVGSSSMEVQVEVRSEDPVSDSQEDIAKARMTFVALGIDGRPQRVPRILPDNAAERQRLVEYHFRARVKSRLRGALVRLRQRGQGFKSSVGNSEPPDWHGNGD